MDTIRDMVVKSKMTNMSFLYIGRDIIILVYTEHFMGTSKNFTAKIYERKLKVMSNSISREKETMLYSMLTICYRQ